MKRKYHKILLDIIMTIAYILLMDLTLTGFLLHEVYGLITIGMIALHLWLNWKWVKGVTANMAKEGTKTKTKIMYWLNVLIFTFMSIIAISGVFISKILFNWLNVGKL